MSTEAEKRAKRKYALKHRKPDSFYLMERRENYNPDYWKPYPFDTRYEVSVFGDIYFKGALEKKRRISHMCKQHTNALGYKTVAINKNRQYSHIVVGWTWIPNHDGKPEIDHIDGNPGNNFAFNLRWATHKENLNNPVSVQRQVESHTGIPSNIKGRVKVWIDKENKKYKMVCRNQIETC